MKLHHDEITDRNVITGYADDHVMVNQVEHTGNLIILPDRLETDWLTGGFAALDARAVATLAALGVEIVLLGTGARQRFPTPAVMRPLIDAKIGFEIMDLPAACRTYNILMGENRNVAAALLFDAA